MDLSLWDHGEDEEAIDFEALRKQGVRFVFIKTSDSNPRADDDAERWFEVDAPAAIDAGMNVGFYQYAVPTAEKADLEGQARQLATDISYRVGRLDPGQLPVVLDLETAPDTLKPSELTHFAVTWLETAEGLTGRTPLLYTNADFAKNRLRPDDELTRFPIWQADYRKGSGAPALPGWPTDAVAFWQFSSAGLLDGKPGTLTDLNVFMGSKDQFARMIGLDD